MHSVEPVVHYLQLSQKVASLEVYFIQFFFQFVIENSLNSFLTDNVYILSLHRFLNQNFAL